MKTIRKNTSIGQNEDGYVLVAVLLFVIVLSVIGIASNHTSNIEIQIAGNERSIAEDFLLTEGELNNDIEDSDAWINDDTFLITGVDEAKYFAVQDKDADGNPDYTLEVRCIEASGTDIATISSYANDIPNYDHVGPAPANAGYSLVNFYVRRFAVTERSADDRTIVQAGVWKAFPASHEE